MKQTISHQQQNQNISKPVVDFSHETTNIDDYSQNRPFSDLNTGIYRLIIWDEINHAD